MGDVTIPLNYLQMISYGRMYRKKILLLSIIILPTKIYRVKVLGEMSRTLVNTRKIEVILIYARLVSA